ncbi:hypothetical protein IE979_12080 [Klebsiella pneumoniae]|uniref:Uncharacterized protein n=1 Tax=Klebsiella pneumoniae TaxID=573 RepID=A0A927E0X8_KLEPN|nr:hypothetical protein [Klebsiella pneumoniae]MBD3722251.1 hypothetical protein [Klebsiella pneumoniae]MBF6066603.1 hypothetical protein [Klebsiella pneumoniae]MCY0627530.1 hypothetical protein [Klebsiella pneumoniae]
MHLIVMVAAGEGQLSLPPHTSGRFPLAYPEPVQARRLTPFVVVCWRTQE